MATDIFPDKKLRPWSPDQVDEILTTASELEHDFSIGQRHAIFRPNLDHIGKPILISLMTDPHYGSSHSDVGLINKHLDLVRDTPNTYVVINGDDVDNYNGTGKWASAMMENPVPPQTISRAWYEKVKPLDDMGKIGVMGFGNHNDFGARAGQDWYESFLANIKAPVFTSGGLLRIEVQDQTYEMAMSHRFWGTSKLNPTNACKRFMEHAYPDADIFFLGHVHMSEGLHFERGGKDRIGVIGGTYKLNDTFARKLGISMFAGSPGHAVMLWPLERKMAHFKDIEMAVKFLKSIISGDD